MVFRRCYAANGDGLQFDPTNARIHFAARLELPLILNPASERDPVRAAIDQARQRPFQGLDRCRVKGNVQDLELPGHSTPL